MGKISNLAENDRFLRKSLTTVGWCTSAGLKKAKITDLQVKKTELKSVSFQEIVPEMERSRRVDGPRIFCFWLTPKIRGARYSPSWGNFVSFHRI